MASRLGIPSTTTKLFRERISSKTLGCNVEIPLSSPRTAALEVDMNCRISPHLTVSRVLLATTLAIVYLPLSRVQLFAQESGSDSATVGQETPSPSPNSGQASSSNPKKADSSSMP